MLARLEIENYGLIDRAKISFAPGATMFTGETGSGKTMILGALACALGARASADIVRRGAARAVVTLVFEPDAALAAALEADGLGVDPGEDATIVREITDAGKSSVRINGRPSTASYVREFAHQIAEIIGQHEAQRLLSPAYHIDLLDRFGGPNATAALAGVADAHAAWLLEQSALDTLIAQDERARESYEEACAVLEEIERIVPEPGEDDRLGERRRYLDNIERIAAALRAAHEALTADETSAIGAFGVASVALDGVASIGSDLAAMASDAAGLQSEAMELAVRVSRALDSTEFDAGELETINARLDALDRLKRRFGGTLGAVFACAQSAREAREEYEQRDERTIALRAACVKARALLEARAAVLTAVRADAATRLCHAVVTELKDVALGAARFEVVFRPLESVGPEGAESAEFAFAANPGEPLRPLARVASGGELSRVLLAIVVALASVREGGALVFDEIDAGIGGATATAVGIRLGRLSRRDQVICVTHLAQLATWAQRHYVLEKHEARNATTISVREIVGDDPRARELARMLSGEAHDAALEHARTLLAGADRM